MGGINDVPRYCWLSVIFIVSFYVVTLTKVDSLRLRKQSKLAFDSCTKCIVYETDQWFLFINSTSASKMLES